MEPSPEVAGCHRLPATFHSKEGSTPSTMSGEQDGAVEPRTGEFTGELDLTSLQIATFSSVSKIARGRLGSSRVRILPLRFRSTGRWPSRERW
jgi:hypothetical protein